MQSLSKVALPVSGILPVPKETIPSYNFPYKQITITVTEDSIVALRQPFACIADAKAYIDRNMYQ